MSYVIRKLSESTIVNKLYYYLVSTLINFIKLFVRVDEELILFVSFGGKQYNDSPKAIYEEMIVDKRFKNYKFIWGLRDTNIYIPGNAKKVKISSFKYFLISLKAKVWVTNSTIERRLNYRGKNNYYFQTWHGTPIKKIGDEKSITYGKSKYDVVCAQSQYDIDIFSEVFNKEKSVILPIGLPRNDVLLNHDSKGRVNLKRQLNLPNDKKVILYCPTFRDWEKNFMQININFDKWFNELGDEYIILYRTHARVPSHLIATGNTGFLYDVSHYHELNDLMIMSDLLITDYSSLSIDYSILEKPIICYTYDIEKYERERGLYFDIRDYIQGGDITEDELLDLIKNLNVEENIKKVKRFRDKFVEHVGQATQKSLDIIYSNIEK